MRKTIIAAAIVWAGLGCGRAVPEQPVAPAKAAAPQPDAEERGNLLNIARGASVVSRTAELTLENSALRAIDGDRDSPWSAPPDDPQQTLLFSLPARARIERLGIRTPLTDSIRLKSVQVEISLDGRSFSPFAAADLGTSAETQFMDITPAEARWIRVSMGGASRFASIQTLYVGGKLLEPADAAPLAGCWTVNGFDAAFAEHDGTISGTIGSPRGEPMAVDGGKDGPTYRLVWTKAGFRGYALVTLSPDGQSFSGGQWFEEPIAYAFGGTWYGERRPCAVGESQLDSSFADGYLQRAAHYPLYGLHFDPSGRLDEKQSGKALRALMYLAGHPSSHRLRVVSHEYREQTPDANRRLAQARLDSLRNALQRRGVSLSGIDLATAGSESPRQPIENETMRVLYGVIEVERPVEGR